MTGFWKSGCDSTFPKLWSKPWGSVRYCVAGAPNTTGTVRWVVLCPGGDGGLWRSTREAGPPPAPNVGSRCFLQPNLLQPPPLRSRRGGATPHINSGGPGQFPPFQADRRPPPPGGSGQKNQPVSSKYQPDATPPGGGVGHARNNDMVRTSIIFVPVTSKKTSAIWRPRRFRIPIEAPTPSA